ncbi:hypothetical protein [Anatilimnocola floriformis]|uniref:hypothetical protein n=1 Tax=Anatilimnocola floriformis TaxID=2948575 RepID=UPI0020C26AEB|nr:hypothetical protein [Anatilimnocola floriformis]
MAEVFDPYRKWLGIPPKDQPPNHYRLLGIAHFEDDPDVIENAATRQMAHVRTYQGGKNGALSQRILNELTAAKLCLLQPAKKATYDIALRADMIASGKLSSSGILEPAVDEQEEIEPPPAEYRSEGRWRTSNDDGAFEFPGPGPAPVPIPMPSGVTPITTAPVGGKARRGPYGATAGRARKPSSAMPVLLGLGFVVLVGLAVAVGMFISKNEPALKTPTKPTTPAEKTTPKPVDKDKPGAKPAEKPTPKKPGTPNLPVTNSQKPSPAPEPSPQHVATTAQQDPHRELANARHALEQRDDGSFRLHISQTEFLLAKHKPRDVETLKADETHLRELEKQLNNFWQAVREGADKKIPKGQAISFKRHNLEIISREGDQLKFKFDGVEQVTAIKKLPSRVAMYMALRVFGQDNVEGKIAIVLFQLIDAEASHDQNSQRLAGRLLEEIDQAGANSNPTLKREREKSTKAS